MKKIKQYFPIIQDGGDSADHAISKETEESFEKFLSNLKIRDPEELVLINPPQVPENLFDVAVAKNKGFYAYPPVGLLYIAAAAKQAKPSLKIKFIDLNYEILRLSQGDDNPYSKWKEILKNEISKCKAPHVGITYMFGATKETFVDVSKYIRETFPNLTVLSGGVQATYDFKEILESKYCDAVFLRESELQFKDFLHKCINKDSAKIPRGLAFSLENKIYELSISEEDAPIDWDIREFYDYFNLDYHNYGSLAAFSRYNGEEKNFATVLSNRGCRARCTFCTVRNFNGFSVRQRDVQSVIDEIKYLVYKKGIEQIDWLDDDLLWDPERTIHLFKGLSEQVPELEWICNNGLIATAITEDIMHWMVKSGMKAFKIGIESGNDKILKEIKKPTTKPKLCEKRELFKKYPEVFVSANFIVGFPNETFEQMMDTYNFANELKWDWSSYYICQPLKGTEMFSAFQALGDARTESEGYEKTLNPGRSAVRGEFGYKYNKEKEIYEGRDVFKIPKDRIPDQDQLKEIWFTFNIVTNFFNNFNFEKGGNPEKMARWFHAIFQAYPYDASMCAALAKSYKLMGDNEKFKYHQQKFVSLVQNSQYWQRRTNQFPELLDFVEVTPDKIVK